MHKFKFKIVPQHKRGGQNIHLLSYEQTDIDGSYTEFKGIKCELDDFLGVCPVHYFKRPQIEQSIITNLEMYGLSVDEAIHILGEVKEGLKSHRIEKTAVPVTMQFTTKAGVEITLTNY